MSTINSGGPAFPVVTRPMETEPGFGHQFSASTWQYGGMTLRDYFAARAMQGFLTHAQAADSPDDVVAGRAYSMADAMLRAREAA